MSSDERFGCLTWHSAWNAMGKETNRKSNGKHWFWLERSINSFSWPLPSQSSFPMASPTMPTQTQKTSMIFNFPQYFTLWLLWLNFQVDSGSKCWFRFHLTESSNKIDGIRFRFEDIEGCHFARRRSKFFGWSVRTLWQTRNERLPARTWIFMKIHARLNVTVLICHLAAHFEG